MSCVDTPYILFCCLISRGEDKGAIRPADAGESFNMKIWKSATLHHDTLLCFCTCSLLCTCTSIQNNHNIIKAAWTILIIILITQCVVSLSILFIDSYLRKKKVVNNKLEMNSCLFSFFRTKSTMTCQWLTSTRHSLNDITLHQRSESVAISMLFHNFNTSFLKMNWGLTWNTSIDLHLHN